MTQQPLSRIIGTGSFLPHRIVENSEVGWPIHREKDEIRRLTGINTRRWAMPEEQCSEFAEESARRALDSAQVTGDSIEALLVSTTSPDTLLPSTACHVQRRLGLKTIPAFDLAASCSGFLYGLSMADAFIRSGQFSRILVVASEIKSRYLDAPDGESRLLFGDGAGAAVVTKEAGPDGSGRGILGIRLFSDGAYHHLVQVPAGGSRMPTSSDTLRDQLHGIQLDGGVLFRVAVKRLSGAIEDLLRDCAVSLSDVKQVIAHQANGRILSAIAKRLGLPESKMYSIIEEYGNTSSASLPIALDHAHRQGVFGAGDLLLLGAIGGGLTWGTSIVRW
jgi:3-oxoacyl-[acyl-carrier-protein] synthase-3